MNICFLLPRFVKSQSGGYKMVYEYANRLAKRNHNISLLYLNENALKRYHLPELVRKIVINKMTKKGPKWINLDNSIKKISTCTNDYMGKISDVDVVVFTAIETIRYYKDFPDVNRVYFVQGYEDWNHSQEYVNKSYGLNLKNIVVAQWLKEMVDNYSKEPSILIKNPIDTTVYRPIVPIESRSLYTISVNYRPEEYKGFKYTYEAITKIKKKYNQLQVYAFGTEKRPEWLPDYFQYTRFATQDETVEIYNKSSVFICGSVEEGYGLTGLEAMACGTVLVSTDYQGVHEYAINEENALLSPVKDSDSLYKNVLRIFNDESLRTKLAKTGVETVKNSFDWNKAVDTFENVIISK